MEFQADSAFVQQFGASQDCLDVLNEATQRVHDHYDAIAPRRTGNMVNRTVEKPVMRKTWEVDLDADIYYSKFVEFGTRYMSAQHNLRNALQMTEAESEG